MVSTRKRIMIIGQPGSGKSTLARKLGAKLNLPVVHIDKIHWQSGWVERTDAEKDQLCAEVHASDTWIFEGGRSPERLNRADTLIWLDFALTTRAWRVFWRTARHHGRTRPDLPEGCPERFNWEFAQWMWNTRQSGRQRMQQLFDSVPIEKEKYRLRNQQAVDELLGNVFG